MAPRIKKQEQVLVEFFADYVGSANDNDDMQVFVKKGGVFTSSNRRRTPAGRGTFDLEYVFDEKTGGLTKDLLARSQR